MFKQLWNMLCWICYCTYLRINSVWSNVFCFLLCTAGKKEIVTFHTDRTAEEDSRIDELKRGGNNINSMKEETIFLRIKISVLSH